MKVLLLGENVKFALESIPCYLNDNYGESLAKEPFFKIL